MNRVLPLLVLLALTAPAATASAQSLAAVAAREEARRKAVKAPSRVYTNQDVRPSARAGQSTGEAPGAAGEAQAQGTPAAGGDAPAADESAQEPPGGAESGGEGEEARSEEDQRADDEARWRERMKEARAALERSQVYEQALQSRINALWADFTARDDPAQRAAIDAERKKAIAHLDRVKAEIVAQKKAIEDIEEEARRAGVPPGWLR